MHARANVTDSTSCATGYGDLVPGTRAAYLVSTIEQCTGIMLSALLLGIVVSRGAHMKRGLLLSLHRHDCPACPSDLAAACLVD